MGKGILLVSLLAYSVLSETVDSIANECLVDRGTFNSEIYGYGNNCPSFKCQFVNSTELFNYLKEYISPRCLMLDISNSHKSTCAEDDTIYDSLKRVWSLKLNNTPIDFLFDECTANKFKSLQQLSLNDNNLSSLHYLNDLFINAPHLFTLDVSFNEIETVNENQFRNPSNLKHLTLDHTSIKSLEGRPFKGLEDLMTLRLSSNQLRKIDETVFSDLKRLTELGVDNNVLDALPKNLFEGVVRLRVLNLRNNRIQIIESEQFRMLDGLESLDLSYNRIGHINAAAFPNAKDCYTYTYDGSISSHQQGSCLKEIRLNNNLLTKITKSCFADLRSLKYLYLDSNEIRNIEPESFSSLTGLSGLYMNDNYIEALPENSFITLKSLVHLHLQNNKISSMESAAFSNLPDLRDLHLYGNSFKKIRKGMLYSFRGRYDLNSIVNLTDCEIETIEPESFVGLENAKVLDLSNNKLEVLGPNAFLGLSSLQELYFYNNTVKVIDDHAFCGLIGIPQLIFYGDTENSSYSQLDPSQNCNSFVLNEPTIAELKNGTFYGLGNLEIAFHNVNITKIGSGAFRGIRPGTSITSNRNSNRDCTGSDNVCYNLNNLSIQIIEPNAFDTAKYNYWTNVNHYYVLLNDNNITALFGHTFRNLDRITLLNLDNSNISSIESYAFDSVSFDFERNNIHDTSVLSLNGNKLRSLKTHTFSNISKIAQLAIRSNQIEKIEAGAFDGLQFSTDHYNIPLNIAPQLNNLDLSRNRIATLISGTFSNIVGIIRLSLESNNIESIEPGTFYNVTVHNCHRSTLDLSNNKLTSIPPNTFTGISGLHTLNLEDNEIASLNPESFAHLDDLTDLILTNNNVKDLVLGALQNSPSLINLQLGENRLLQFRTGIFSNLDSLKCLNISRNKFSNLNETVLFPLRNLNTFDLDNNNFSYIDYGSLLLHLPCLSSISVNNNRWHCNFLTRMLKTFDGKGIHYMFTITPSYDEANVHGISCKESEDDEVLINGIPIKRPESSKDLISLLSFHVQPLPSNKNELNIPNLQKNMSDIFDSLKSSIDSLRSQIAEQNSKLQSKISPEILFDLKNNISELHSYLKESHYSVENRWKNGVGDHNVNDTSDFSSLYISFGVIICLCILTVTILLVTNAFKRYYQKVDENRILSSTPFGYELS